MDGYESEITRQPGGPFSNRQERKTLRACAEHWASRRRYSEERNRRFASYAKWIGIVGTPALLVLKLVEAYLAKAP